MKAKTRDERIEWLYRYNEALGNAVEDGTATEEDGEEALVVANRWYKEMKDHERSQQPQRNEPDQSSNDCDFL